MNESIYYKPQYYCFEPKKTDDQGMTHGYRSEYPRNQIRYDDFKDGMPRLYEVPRSSTSIYSKVLVSENVREFLKLLKLPSHKFMPKELIHYKLTTDTSFFMLELAENTIFEYLDWEKEEFYYTYTTKPITSVANFKYQFPISSLNDIRTAQNQLKESLHARSVTIRPSKYIQMECFDIITLTDSRILGMPILVPDYFKIAFEKHFPNQINFVPIEKFEIQVKKEDYIKRRKIVEQIEFSPNALSYKIDKEFLYYYDKMNRLKSKDDSYKIQEDNFDEFTELENKLKLIIPEAFKNIYRRFPDLENYKFHTIKQFLIETEYQSSLPETFKSLIFAGDGTGDELGLLLKRESDYELSDQWYCFSHEDGLVHKIDNIEDYIKN